MKEEIKCHTEKSPEETKRRLEIEKNVLNNISPANLFLEEEKRVVTFKPRHMLAEDFHDEFEDKGGILYQEDLPFSKSKNLDIFNNEKDFVIVKERVTTRASTNDRQTPL